jgi:3-isopropylmalate dehydratase small subunit
LKLVETVAPSLTAHSYFSGQHANDQPLSLRDGLDEIGLSLQKMDKIATYEAGRPAWMPTIS